MTTMEIPLNHGLVALIDEADELLIRPYQWYAAKDHNTFYALAAAAAPGQTAKKSTVRMHQLILGGCGSLIDHVNRNGIDNRRSNLRLATPTENQCNRGPASDNQLGLKGVYWDKERQKFRASINVHRRRFALGRYDSAIEAAKAYDQAALSIHGSFAHLNFPDITS